MVTKKSIAYLLIVLSCWCKPAMCGQRFYPASGCAAGPDGSCAPRRITYGYYPTMWRRWPEALPGVGPREPERVPTPAKAGGEELPSVEPETPSTPPAQDSSMPDLPGSEPAMPAPETEPSMPSFEDSPPTPPTDIEKPSEPLGEPSPADVTPEAPAPVQPLPDADAPPSMPDDDPFKDEPPVEKPAAEPTRGASRTPVQQATAIHWRGKIESRMDAVETQPVPKESGEPNRLKPAEGALEISEGPALMDNAGLKRNPLRATQTATKPRTERVVPAAHWTSQRDSSTAATAAPRRNPLRAN